jgi:anti-sigma factor RsiW
MKTRCDEIRSLFDRLLDGDLPERELKMLEEHMRDCAGCRAAAEAEKDIVRALAELPDVPCPDSVVRSIEDATFLRRGKAPRLDRLRSIPLPLRWSAASVGLAGAVIVVLLLVIGRFEPTGRPKDLDPQTELAGKQARWALSYVVQKIDEDGRQRTGEFVQNDLPLTIRNCLSGALPDFKGDRK